MNPKSTRRKFIATTVAATATTLVTTQLISRNKDGEENQQEQTATTSSTTQLVSQESSSYFDPKDLPTRPLGKTGVEVPLIILGCGSRFTSISNEDQALSLLESALNQGLYAWDTAANYGNSEEILGKLLKTRRKEVFISSKVAERSGDGAKRSIEKSLQRLQTDYIDLLKIHSIRSEDDVKNLGKKGKVLDVLKQYKEQGIIKYIGFSGHTSASAMRKAAERYDFDTMLIAMNHQRPSQSFEEQAIPMAGSKGMGVLAMKVVRRRETIEGLNPKDLIQYALSLEYVSSAVIAIDSMKILNDNLAILRNFQPLSPAKMEEIRVSLAPFYRHENLAWMEPDYQDGVIV